jgi:hypothetical protein
VARTGRGAVGDGSAAELVLSFLRDSAVLAFVLCLLLVAALAVLVGRRRVLSRRGGAFTCALRRRHAGEGSARGWALGVARYSDDYVEWFRIFSLMPRPGAVLDRRSLAIATRRVPEGLEAYAVPHDSMILVCSDLTGPVDLALDEAAATGLQVWLEAVPPGTHSTV